MHIDEINLSNFRNIKSTKIYPGEGINIIFGGNAHGKTSLIESIYICSNLKSFRGKNIDEAINNESDSSKINIRFYKNKTNNILSYYLSKKENIFTINNNILKKKSDYLGFIETILFYPDDIYKIKGTPTLRRSLIDRAVFQTSENYLVILQKYLHCLKQRNSAIKNKSMDKNLWDTYFIKYAQEIYDRRIEFLKRINLILNDIYKNIYKLNENIYIKYSSIEENTETYSDYLENKLKKLSDKENLYGATLVGPHREDFLFLLNEKPISLYGSQGQQRSLMLAFKTAQIIDFKNLRGIYPVLLLDDIAGELDKSRKDIFLSSLLEHAGQVFMTSTDTSLRDNNFGSEVSYFQAKDGVIEVVN